MNQEVHDEPTLAVAPDAGSQLRRRRLQNQYGTHLVTRASPTPSMIDAARFHWIRANRGNFAINDALMHSDRDADFDAKIDAAMDMSAAGRHFYASLDDLA